MCVPTIVGTALKASEVAFGVGSSVFDLYNNSKNQEYRTQAAIANAKNSINEANYQRQQGIEESRKQKLEGQKQASEQMAQAGAMGFDVNSNTNIMNFQDTIDFANSEAQETKDKYDLISQQYLDKANEYLNDANISTSNYNSNLYSKAINYLGSTNKVAQGWYKGG